MLIEIQYHTVEVEIGFLEKGQFENSRESRILEAFLETLENSREFLRNSYLTFPIIINYYIVVLIDSCDT